jgi:hypothetical protein
MDRDYAKPLDVPALARVALMSPGHFSRSFRAAYRGDAYHYLMTRRIERAKVLLRRGDPSSDGGLLRGRLHLDGVVQLAVHRAGRREPELLPGPPP